MKLPAFPRISSIAASGLAAVVLCASASAAAQDYPARPIRIVVPFAPGGGSDVTARVIGKKLQDAWGQPVVVENQPGASTQIGTRSVIRAAPDGYTLLLATTSIVNNAHLYPRLDYDAMKELVPVVGLVSAPPALAVGPAIKAANMRDFIAEIKAKAATPHGVTFGSAGTATTMHLASEWLAGQLGIHAVHSPYKSGSQDAVALAQGDVDFSFENLPPLKPMADSGKVRLLMIGSRSRFPSVPGLPTPAEAGLPDVELSSWYLLMAPAKTPAPVIESINREVGRILKEPDVRAALVELGLAPMDATLDQLRQRMADDFKLWGGVIRDAKVSVE